MIIPVRCFSCGKPLGHLNEKYEERITKGDNPGKVLTELGVKRQCCRGVFISNVNLIDIIAEFKKH